MDGKRIVNSLAITDTWADGIGPVGTISGGLVRIPFFTIRTEVRQLSACLTLPSHVFRRWVSVASLQHYAANQGGQWKLPIMNA